MKAVYLCTLGCVENCPCEVRACIVNWTQDGQVDRMWIDSPINHEETITEGHPCVVFRSDAEHPHPPKHIAVDDEGRYHQWADGDTACQITIPCPECGMTECPGSVRV